MADELFLISIFGAVGLGFARLGELRTARTVLGWRRVAPAFALWLVVAIPTTVQLTLFPHLEILLRRDEREISGHGQVWRLVTAVVVQDGGVAGAIFNLVALALLAPVVVLIWDRRTMWLAFFAGAIGGEVVGLAWQPLGAGNSVGCCGLAAAVLVSFVAAVDRTDRETQGRAAIASCLAAAGLLQLAFLEIHGAAFATGLVVMAAVALHARSTSAHRPRTVLGADGERASAPIGSPGPV